MDAVFTLLKAKQFNINAANTITEVTTRSGTEASDDGLASFINACREDPHFKDYKLIPCGSDAFIVAVDYSYEEGMQKLIEYASAIIKADLEEYFRGRRVKAGSFKLIFEDGKLCYQYEAYELMMGFYMHRKDPVPKIEEEIIQRAMQVLPHATHPKQA